MFVFLVEHICGYIIKTHCGLLAHDEAACVCSACITTIVGFIYNTIKFANAVTWLSQAVSLSYRANTFLLVPIKLKMKELSANVVKTHGQSFQLLWCLFPHLRLKLGCLEKNYY